MDDENCGLDPESYPDFCVKLAATMIACTDRAVKLYGSKQRAIDAVAEAGMWVQDVLSGEPEEMRVLVLHTLLALHVRRLTDGTPTIRPANPPESLQ